MAEDEVAEIISKVLSCLNYLKNKGVCHRDIKPENILYDPRSGDVKIIDFELAKMKKYEADTLDLWTSTGSLYYRAPESFSIGYNETVDVWAAGVLLFELLTGKLPFSACTVKNTVYEIKQKNIDYDSLEFSWAAKKMLRGMLEKNPNLRLTPK